MSKRVCRVGERCSVSLCNGEHMGGLCDACLLTSVMRALRFVVSGSTALRVKLQLSWRRLFDNTQGHCVTWMVWIFAQRILISRWSFGMQVTSSFWISTGTFRRLVLCPVAVA
jgi:hypothetical protein